MTPPIKESCSKHEAMVISATKLESEVKAMAEQQDRITSILDKLTEKLNGLERSMILWGGALGFGGSVLVAIISNLDKIKALFA